MNGGRSQGRGWEYCQVTWTGLFATVYQAGAEQVKETTPAGLSRLLDGLGGEGWEMVGVVKFEGAVIHHFKRPTGRGER